MRTVSDTGFFSSGRPDTSSNDGEPSLQNRRSVSLPQIIGLDRESQDGSGLSVQEGPARQMRATGMKRLGTAKERDAWSDQDLVSLAERMQRELEIRERSKGFKRYGACFLGSDAVAWMVSNSITRDADGAVRLGNDLLRMGLLYHVSYKYPFLDKPHFYMFHTYLNSSGSESETEPSPDSNGNRRNVASSDGGLSSTGRQKRNIEERWKPATEINRLQRRLADQTSQINEFKEISGVMFEETSRQLKTMGALLKQHHEQMSQGWAAHEHTTQQLQDLAHSNKVNILVTLVVAAVFVPQMPALLAIPLGCCLLGFSWHLLGPWLSLPWPMGHKKPPPSHMSVPFRPTDDFTMPVQFVSPFAAYASAPANISVQGSLDRDGSCGGSPQPPSSHRAEQPPPAQSEFEGWQDAPLLLRPRALPQQIVYGLDQGRIAVNTGRPIEFETDLFKGQAVIYVAGLASAPQGLFAGQRRRTAITVQGQFKQELNFDEVLTGQEFARPAKQLPAKWLVETVLIQLARKISPSMVIGPLSAPHVLAPLVAMAQEINVAKPGRQPDPCSAVSEDMRLVCPQLVDKNGGPMPVSGRKQHFWSVPNREKQKFDTTNVWTFTLYQHFVDMSAYELNMVRKFDLAGHLDGQPLQFMMKHRSSEQYLFNFEAWHEHLLPAALQHH